MLEADAAGAGRGRRAALARVAEDIEPLFAALVAARAAEGAALAAILAGQLDRVEALARAARAGAEARAGRNGALLRSRVEALLAAPAVPVGRGAGWRRSWR